MRFQPCLGHEQHYSSQQPQRVQQRRKKNGPIRETAFPPAAAHLNLPGTQPSSTAATTSPPPSLSRLHQHHHLFIRCPLGILLVVLRVFLLFVLIAQCVSARRCYSCSGQCLAGAPCNCQMGSCQADHCFTDKRPSGVPGVFRLSKGCMRRPARTRGGCDFDHYADHVLCLCSGPGDFCNDHIVMRVNMATWRNVTCRHCPDGRPDCGQTCQGQWCHQKTSTGASGCGFGPPALPYHYQSTELLLRQHPKVCISMSRSSGGGGTSIGGGGGMMLRPHRFCICLGHLCNEPDPGLITTGSMLMGGNGRQGSQQQPNLFTTLLHSLGAGGRVGGGGTAAAAVVAVNQRQQQQSRNQRQWELTTLARAQQVHEGQQFFDCVSCDLSSDDVAATTSNCRQNRCRGQFCVYGAQRVFIGSFPVAAGVNGDGQGIANGNGAIFHGNGQGGGKPGSGVGGTMMYERQGCINVTEPAFVQMGCTHKWVQNELEEIFCACRGQLCNVDLRTASASSAKQMFTLGSEIMVLFCWCYWLASLLAVT